MISVILLSLGITLGIVVATRRLLPRVPDWLTISFVMIVPPFFHVVYAIYRTLIKIGMYEAENSVNQEDIVSDFSSSVHGALFEGAIWAVLALAVSIMVLRVLDRNAEK